MRVTFFRFAERKSPKKGRPCCARPFASLRATCDARSGCAPQNSLRAARSAQTTAASQCTKCVCPAAHARTPCPALLGTRRREPAAGHPFGPLLRSAAPAQREALAHARSGRAKQRPVWLFGCSAVWMFGCSAIHPLLAAPAAGRLRGEHGRLRAHASSSDSPWLSGRRAPAQSEFHGAPRNRSDAGLPRSEAKGSQTGGRPFFGDFLSAKRKKVTRTPGDSRPPPSTKARLSNEHAPASTSSARTGSGKSKLPKQ